MPDNDKSFVRILYLIIFGQFVVIAILLGGLSNEYLSNAYMRAWIEGHTPFLSFLLHGEVDSLLVGISIGATVLLVQGRIRDARSRPSAKLTDPPPPPTYMPAPAVQNPTRQGDPLPDSRPPPRTKRSGKKPIETAPEGGEGKTDL